MGANDGCDGVMLGTIVGEVTEGLSLKRVALIVGSAVGKVGVAVGAAVTDDDAPRTLTCPLQRPLSAQPSDRVYTWHCDVVGTLYPAKWHKGWLPYQPVVPKNSFLPLLS